jgi:predicted DCC family thiol-disulfide oxidoreductase YuxK
VLYDGDCGFCAWALSLLLKWDRGRQLQPLALQRRDADELLGELTPDERMASWHLISPTGERHSGGAAVPELLRVLPGGRTPAAVLLRIPRPIDHGYTWIAQHRSQLSRVVPSAAKNRSRDAVSRREREALGLPSGDA